LIVTPLFDSKTSVKSYNIRCLERLLWLYINT